MQERTLNGPAVKALREALGIPAAHFANECLMSPGQLSSIETSRKPASEDATRRIVTAIEKAYANHAAEQDHQRHRSTPVDLVLALTYPKADAA